MRRRLRSSWWRWLLVAAAALLVAHWYGWADTRGAIAAAGGAAWSAIMASWPLLLAVLAVALAWRAAAVRASRWLWRRPRAVMAGLLGAAALCLVWVVFVWLPTWFVPDGTIADQAALYRARNDVRTTAVQATAGLVVLLGAYFTWRQVRHSRDQLEVARQGQVTERFTRAIDQLGSDQLDIRLGGIHALERIARDSEVDRPTIAEVLTAYVHQHSPWPPTQPGQYRPDWPLEQQPDLRTRASDVHAALTVLGRGGFARLAAASDGWLDLHASDLRKADLAHARLEHAYLRDAHLEGADLHEARLEGADLRGAQLKRADLDGAHVEWADLRGATWRR